MFHWSHYQVIIKRFQIELSRRSLVQLQERWEIALCDILIILPVKFAAAGFFLNMASELLAANYSG